MYPKLPKVKAQGGKEDDCEPGEGWTMMSAL